MVTLLITSVLFLGLFAVAVYFWQKPANKSESIQLPPVIAPTSLFPNTTEALPSSTEEEQTSAFLSRAKAGDLTVLLDARHHSSYLAVLESVVSTHSSTNTIHKLAAFITENDLPTNRSLVDALTALWEVGPDRQLTIQLLHVTALADDAELFNATVNRVLDVARDDNHLNISNSELLFLINSEYWLLSSNERSSGAGFILKRTLSSARRELEGTNN